ncbi:MAG: sigma 54-interacting transcriptional regulator [Pseudomonadota bacterium]
MIEQDLNVYWKTVVDTIQDGIMIVSTDGMIVSVNQAFQDITGYTEAEIVGRSCSVLDCTSCEIERGTASCHWCRLFQRGEIRKQKCMMKGKNGSMVNIVKNASLLRDTHGQVIGAVETMTDITDLIDKEIQIESFRRELRAEDRFHGMIGASPAMLKVFELITNAAESDAPVIVYGESGTGKELVASALHQAGSRRDKPFIKVNCSALSESVLESELFGHVKGAFTGAIRDREGRFEAASGGDIFLDEIGDLPFSIQVKLLRVLEEKVVERVGDNRSVPVDIRILSATNRDLKSLITQGRFREDLYYRINVIPIHVPPLRDRSQDIPLLAESFFRRIKLKNNRDIQGISKEALDRLLVCPWPGNVRELKSSLEYAFVACRGKTIRPEHLPGDLPDNLAREALSGEASWDMEDLKRQRLVKALASTGGNQSRAAELLGLSRTSVWSQIKRFNINPREFSS